MLYDYAVLWDWLSLGVRWLHVIAGIAWIGSSFYFIALDLGLRKDGKLPKGVSGEEWQVHGGGFYHIRKYIVAPASLPERLVWFKWESYVTWLSGFALLAIIYYVSADLYLIDPQILHLTTSQAIAISIFSLIFGWLLYDFLCRKLIDLSPNLLMILLFFILVLTSYFYCHIFSGRAAFLHIGALIATLMSGNVFFIIMPNQKIVVSDLKSGKVPDSKYGIIAKQRSIHNNYLTLPVLFMMISNHYPLAFATEYNWIIAALVFLMGVTIRHYFNSHHSRSSNPTWTWIVTALLFVFAAWLSSLGPKSSDTETSQLSFNQQHFASHADFIEVREIIDNRCVMCHSSSPVFNTLLFPPKDIVLENDSEIIQLARDIYLQAGRSRAMPTGNISNMTDAERMTLVRWYEDSLLSRH